MKKKTIQAKAAQENEDLINCPHCDFENEPPQGVLMKEVPSIICRRCQRIIPWEKKY